MRPLLSDERAWVRPGGPITLEDAARCPLLRHALDLRYVADLPPQDRQDALLWFHLYDMRAAARERAERRRELLREIEWERSMAALERLLDSEQDAKVIPIRRHLEVVA